jgi:hypothetical protein
LNGEYALGFFLIYGLLLVALYVIAKNQGKDAIRVVFWSAILTPIVGVIILLLSKPDQKKIEEYQTRHGDLVKCPDCAELIKAEANKCKHCGSTVSKAA